VLGVDRKRLDYVVREQCKRNRLRVKMGKIATKTEDKMDDGREENTGEKRKRTRRRRRKRVIPEERVSQ
jgi:hypothetical protein